MRRLLALLVLAALVFAALYVMKYRPGTVPEVSAPKLEGVGEKLEGVGERLGEFGDKVGDKLRSTRTTGGVKAALELNRNLASLPIDVSAEETVVILRGEVPTEELRLQAERVAAGVPDVSQVRNELRVNPGVATAAAPGADRTLGESVDDKGLEAKVNLAFSLNRALKGTNVSVRSFRREVVLGGQVASEVQHQLALQIARETPGVLTVRDELAVGGAAPPPAAPPVAAPAGASPMTPAAALPPAGTIVSSPTVEAALAANPNLSVYGIRAREEGGRILLTGAVRTAAEKDLASLVAKEAAGGRAVQNDVVIKP